MLPLLLTLVSAGALSQIACPGHYTDHVQGIATDDVYNIYWSFTVALLKTDAEGKLIKTVEVPDHHGDPWWREGRLYVAVNHGLFNMEAGKADSWVYVYSSDLELLDKHPVSELVHGAGGIAWNGAHFVLVGGLPPKHDMNYLYLYDDAFTFIERKDVPTGYTRLGIQTVCAFKDSLWLGTYSPEKGLIQVDREWRISGTWPEKNAPYGIAPWKDGQLLIAQSKKGTEPKTFTATATPVNPQVYPSPGVK